MTESKRDTGRERKFEVVVTARFEPAEVEFLRRRAAASDRSVSWILRELVRDSMRAAEGEKSPKRKR
jgi:hypothetical protein